MKSILLVASVAAANAANQMGASFSQHELEARGLDWRAALVDYKTLGFNFVRLGLYWSDCESTEGVFDFSEMDEIMDSLKDSGIKVLLTVGMKAPRDPEFYIP
jgi:beta-galactosidase GanA